MLYDKSGHEFLVPKKVVEAENTEYLGVLIKSMQNQEQEWNYSASSKIVRKLEDEHFRGG
jgi:hypothetical protein